MTTMIGPLRRAVQVAPERSAVRCGDVELTYAEMWERTRRLAGGLRELGLEPGDRVAVVGGNCHRYLELYQGVPGSGLALVPLNQRHTAAELAYALEDSGASVLFAGAGVDVPSGAAQRVIDLEDGYEALLAGARPAEFPDSLAPDAIAGLFYTGGTTGAAKGVILTHRNLIANAMHFQAAWQFGPDTRWLIIPPLFHAAGSIAVLAMIWHAGRQVVLSAFDPGARARLDRVRADHRDPGGADDAGGDLRRAAGQAPRRLVACPDQPRRRPGRHRDAAPGARGLRRCAADAPLRRHRDRADRDDPPT